MNIKIMKNFIKINLLFILILFYFLPSVSLAAEVFLVSAKNVFTTQEEFSVQVYINTENISVNAIEGKIVFPSDLLELKDIRDGNSSINFWIERPSNINQNNISFSGITAGGFSGSKKFLFTAVFKSKVLGDGIININNVKILQNDGVGTEIATSISPLNFSISNEPSVLPVENLVILDNEPPEEFTPLIAKDPTIFDGKYFLVFSAIDKGVGIDHYQVREGIWNEYIIAESPYLLSDQSLSKDILIKAVDKQGNKRIVKMKAQNPSFGLEEVLIIGIILLLCYSVLKKIWEKFIR
jgi:hypothetical protein